MKNLKDNNKKPPTNKHIRTISFEGKLPNYYKIPGHGQLVDIAHKSQKITTAIYMITDLIPPSDPLVHTLRSTSVSVMHKLFSTTSAPQAKWAQELSEIAGGLYGLSAYLQVVYDNAKVSDMNYELLVSEINKLQDRIDNLTTKNMPYDRQKKASQVVDEFTFTDTFFETPSSHQKDTPRISISLKDSASKVKDINLKQKETLSDIIEQGSPKSIQRQEKTQSMLSSQRNSVEQKKKTSLKNERHENILKILKQKRDAKIGDLTSLIKDCGPKTVQRDLNELVKKELVKKEGERRWSVYNLAY